MNRLKHACACRVDISAGSKPEAALPRIIEGRVNGYFKENVLLEQAFAKDQKKSVAQVLKEAGAEATGFARFRVGN